MKLLTELSRYRPFLEQKIGFATGVNLPGRV